MKKFIIILSLFITSSVFAINSGDSIKHTISDSLKTQEVMAWINRLDSLLNNHYYLRQDSIPKGEVVRDSLVLDLPDSVYRERLARLYSPVDLSFNKEVKRNIEHYIDRAYKQVPRLLALSEYYFPMFERIMDQYDIPYEMKYLAVIESALNPQAVSRVGATGLWQFMYRTGKFVGLEINSYVDERRDPIASTHAACKYLHTLDTIYNDWVLALAAYNCGPGNVNRAIRRAGGTGNFWKIYHYLPRETRNYVPAFIAVNYLFEYYDKHGFKAAEMDLPHAIDTLTIKKDLHFGQLSDVLGISMADLRFFNPQYKRDLIPGNEKPRHLILPIGYIPAYIAAEDSIHLFKDSIYLNPNKIAYKPVSHNTSHYPTASQPSGTKKLTYTIKSGDALGLIASWYGVSTSQLKAWNGLYTSRIQAGKSLVVYVPESKYEYYKKVNTMSRAAKQSRIGKTTSTSSHSPTAKLDPDYEYYTVKRGDNPWEIAKRYPGISASDILQLNNIDSETGLKPGQKLKIRKKS
jgi:membrane-bound lytic murein transglycosylase D